MIQNKHFYICSYGGSGSWLLFNFLKNHGLCYHIHCRNLPLNETRVIKALPPSEEYVFDYNITPPKANVFFIFIYARPQYSIMSSRSYSPQHFSNIECQYPINLIPKKRIDYFNLKEDLVNYEQFWENYVFHTSSFPVLCLNFHYLWDNLKALCDFCEIDREHINAFPKKRQPSHKNIIPEDVNSIFTSLNNKIDLYPNAFIIPGK
jgi:hypothetical protein